MNIINSSDIAAITPFFQRLHFPSSDSHKGQNGKLLVVGGSSLFHSASIWAAEIASHFVDMVHYCSTKENAEVMLSLKKKFQNGMVIRQEDLSIYVNEDDVVLVGPGMMRGELKPVLHNLNLPEILQLQKNSESNFTYYLSQYLLSSFPDKKFVLDAGVLQMMDKKWLLELNTKPILTPHIKEFSQLSGVTLSKSNIETIAPLMITFTKQYNCILMVKMIDDIVTDGENTYVINGGNAGLTKGGTGDILAGLTASSFTHSDPLTSAIISSFVLKASADQLYREQNTWYNNDDIIDMIPRILTQIYK